MCNLCTLSTEDDFRKPHDALQHLLSPGHQVLHEQSNSILKFIKTIVFILVQLR